MKYLIDHTTQLIHRASQIRDLCDVHTTVANQRESTQDDNYIEKLVASKQYQYCDQCRII